VAGLGWTPGARTLPGGTGRRRYRQRWAQLLACESAL